MYIYICRFALRQSCWSGLQIPWMYWECLVFHGISTKSRNSNSSKIQDQNKWILLPQNNRFFEPKTLPAPLIWQPTPPPSVVVINSSVHPLCFHSVGNLVQWANVQLGVVTGNLVLRLTHQLQNRTDPLVQSRTECPMQLGQSASGNLVQ